MAPPVAPPTPYDADHNPKPYEDFVKELNGIRRRAPLQAACAAQGLSYDPNNTTMPTLREILLEFWYPEPEHTFNGALDDHPFLDPDGDPELVLNNLQIPQTLHRTPAVRAVARQQSAILHRLWRVPLCAEFALPTCVLTHKSAKAFSVVEIAHVWAFHNTFSKLILVVEYCLGKQYSDSLNLNSRFNNIWLACEEHRAWDSGAIGIVPAANVTNNKHILQVLFEMLQFNSRCKMSARKDVLGDISNLMPPGGWKCYVVSLTLDDHFVLPVYSLEKDKDDKYITTHKSESYGPPFGQMPLVHVHANPVFFALNVGERMAGVPVEDYPPVWTSEEKESVRLASKIWVLLKNQGAVDPKFKPKRRDGLRTRNRSRAPSCPGTPETRFIGPLTMYDVDDVDALMAAKTEQRERFASIGVSRDELAVLEEGAQTEFDD